MNISINALLSFVKCECTHSYIQIIYLPNFSDAADFASAVLVQDMGCWKDTADRAIQPVEKQFPALQDNYWTRAEPLGKCLAATMCLSNNVFSLQNGGWCATTGDAQDTYQKFGASAACKPDGAGGPWGNQVYKINSAVSG